MRVDIYALQCWLFKHSDEPDVRLFAMDVTGSTCQCDHINTALQVPSGLTKH